MSSSREEKLLIAVSRLRNLMHRELENVFRKYELTITQFSVLEVIKHKGPKSVGEIQEYVLGTSGNIPLVIKNLERDDLVLRIKPESDRRISIITLTKKGKQIVDEAYEEQKLMLKDLLKDIDENKIEVLTEKLFEVFNNLR
ncbi:MarR family transcriptional regulator [Streptobacillus felis]|uniref:HTH-type transcriptional regulator SarZ n=1 Tax=Streptobacillus felis TaxID=1384509 RepID=A0A7Z0PF62_9FUSO|nr:MarR family transcriptional regulator [Streptobacillus felis]NYV28062.1 MarR family transcriptional regulator [Streptobacillus felis]